MRRRAEVRCAALCLAAIVAARCGHSDPASPEGTLAGAWSGTIVDAAAGTGTIQLQMSVMDAGLSGTWGTTFPDASRNRAGTFSGIVTASSVSLFLTPSQALTCPGAVTLTGTMGANGMLTGARITATYTVFICAGTDDGSFDISKTS